MAASSKSDMPNVKRHMRRNAVAARQNGKSENSKAARHYQWRSMTNQSTGRRIQFLTAHCQTQKMKSQGSTQIKIQTQSQPATKHVDAMKNLRHRPWNGFIGSGILRQPAAVDMLRTYTIMPIIQPCSPMLFARGLREGMKANMPTRDGQDRPRDAQKRPRDQEEQPKKRPNPSPSVFKPLQIERGSVHASPETVLRFPRAPINRPGGAPEGPKRIQEAPTSSRKPAKWRPRERQTPPKPSLASPRRVLSAIFAERSLPKAPGTILRRFLACACGLRYIKNLDFCCSCQRFVRVGAFTHVKPTCTKKHRKMRCRSLQNLPQTVPEPVKIEAGASRNVKKWHTGDEEPPETSKTRPKSDKSAQNEPT